MEEAVIVSYARTPIGRAFKGALVDSRGDDLTRIALDGALARIPELKREDIEDLVLGCAQPAGECGYNMARAVAVLAGLNHVPGVTVNRYCASSLQAIAMCSHAIQAGAAEVMVAAGVETASRFRLGKSDGMPDTKNPRFAEAQARSTARAEAGASIWSEVDGLADYYIPMGQTAENVAQLEGVTREAMDAFALRSQQRASEARESGVFAREIVPVPLSEGLLEHDESPRPSTTLEKLAGLKPVFRPDGTVTAGNACPLNDGAAAVIVMARSRAESMGLKPLARIVSSAVSALNPEIMGLGPVEASNRALKRAGMRIQDVDLVEMNEAFAAQVLPSAEKLGISDDKLNVHGGAIALGHPFGMTGARMMATLLNALERQDGSIGLETMCVGGGQGMAMVVERL